MIKGIIFALTACFIWGMIFIIPRFMQGFDAFETALGRHFIFGLLSVCLFLFSWKTAKTASLKMWKAAFLYSLVANIIYYSCVVFSVRYSSPAIAALIQGMSPIVIAFYGNWKEKACNFRDLIFPTVLILFGLVLINIPAFQQSWSGDYLLGISAAFLALIAWSWFVVANAVFLREHAQVKIQDWVTLMGTATFVWAVILGTVYEFSQGSHSWARFVTPSSELAFFIGGCLILGIVCSWLGNFLWSKASTLLPISLAGQLSVFETIFGVVFVYIVQGEMPVYLEMTGICIILAAILYGVNLFSEAEAPAM